MDDVILEGMLEWRRQWRSEMRAGLSRLAGSQEGARTKGSHGIRTIRLDRPSMLFLDPSPANPQRAPRFASATL